MKCKSKGLFTGLINIPNYILTPKNIEMAELAKVRGDILLGEAKESHSKRSMCDYRSFKLICGHIQDVRMVHYRKGPYSCRDCFSEDLHNVAKSQSLTLKSEEIVDDQVRRIYIRDCGHEEKYSNNYLRKHKINPCTICKESIILNNSKVNNFKVIDKNTDNLSYNIMFNDCGHSGRILYKTAEVGNPTCRVCLELRMAQDALNCNLTYLNTVDPKVIQNTNRTSIYRAYSCNTCGHIDYYGHSAVHLKNVRCDVCYTNRLKEEAVFENLEYLGLGTGRGKHFYKLPCGCLKNINPYAVKIGSWVCHEHEETYYNRPNNLYLLKITNEDYSWLKLGYAKHVATRFRGYNVRGDAKYELLYIREFDTTYEAMLVEKKLHTLLNTLKLDKIIMKNYMLGTGHTECYPLEVCDIIMEELKKVKEIKYD